MADKVERIEMKILIEGQDITVFGPLQNRILCLGILEAAKEAVLDSHRHPGNTVPVPSIPRPRPELIH